MDFCARLLLLSTIILGSWSCGGPRQEGAGNETSARTGPAGPRYVLSAREIVNVMSIEEKCAQLLMISLGGAKDVPSWFVESFGSVPVGGVVFLGSNMPATAAEVVDFTARLQAIALGSRTGIPIFIAVDHEGGPVFRFGGIMTRLRSAESVARTGRSRDEVLALYRNSSAQLAALGFSMNFAPVLEPLTKENRGFLGPRSYSADPATVAVYGGLFVEAMRKTGVTAVGKHFPGSGDGDPHRGLPRLEASREGMEALVLPFREAAAKGLPGIMVSHVLCPALDSANPATLSARIQNDLLRSELGFRGFAVSDDLNMKAVSARLPASKAAVLAVGAGTDLLMYLPRDYGTVHAALVSAVKTGELQQARVDGAAVRIVEAKLEAGLWISARKSASERKEDFRELKRRGDVLAERFGK